MPSCIRGNYQFLAPPPGKRAAVAKAPPYRDRNPNKGVPWSEQEKADLTRMLRAGQTIRQVAEHYPTRTANAVSHMASVLGLRRSARYEREQKA